MNFDIDSIALIAIAALLYSAVGHGGVSGYLAAMSLFGLAPTIMKPTNPTIQKLLAVVLLVAGVKMIVT